MTGNSDIKGGGQLITRGFLRTMSGEKIGRERPMTEEYKLLTSHAITSNFPNDSATIPQGTLAKL